MILARKRNPEIWLDPPKISRESKASRSFSITTWEQQLHRCLCRHVDTHSGRKMHQQRYRTCSCSTDEVRSMQSGIGSIQLLNYEIKAWRTKLFIKTLLKHLLDGCFMMAGLASTLCLFSAWPANACSGTYWALRCDHREAASSHMVQLLSGPCHENAINP